MRKFSPEGESFGHLPAPATNQKASSTSVQGISPGGQRWELTAQPLCPSLPPRGQGWEARGRREGWTQGSRYFSKSDAVPQGVNPTLELCVLGRETPLLTTPVLSNPISTHPHGGGENYCQIHVYELPDFQGSPKHCLQETAQPVDRRRKETLAKLAQQFSRKAHSAGKHNDPKGLGVRVGRESRGLFSV